jgi:hypothetical protein
VINENSASVIVTCEDEGRAITIARLIEKALRDAGFPEVRPLSLSHRDRAQGIFPVEVDRVRALGQETFVVIGTARTRP